MAFSIAMPAKYAPSCMETIHFTAYRVNLPAVLARPEHLSNPDVNFTGFAANFGGVVQYGTLLKTTYLAFGGHGATIDRFNNFHQTLPGNPCTAG